MRMLGLLGAIMVALMLATAPRPADAQLGISITVAPPALPVYVQPPIPEAGYLWTPGYWAWGPDGYYWVPGTWVMPPEAGLLWTPGYWGWGAGGYLWNAGYWGPHVGFYGGISYGFGYFGVGFAGGFWRDGEFNYNSAVTNVHNTTITNVYNKTVTNTTVNRTSYNGGTGGTSAKPTPEEEAAAQEHHTPPTDAQAQHEHAASTNRALLASENRGKPPIAATAHPGEFTGKGVVPARAAGGRAARGAAHPETRGETEAREREVTRGLNQREAAPRARPVERPAERSDDRPR